MTVDIAFSINRTLQVPLLVVLNSILSNTTHQSSAAPLRFNIVVPDGEAGFFEEKLAAAFSKRYEASEVEFRVREFLPPGLPKAVFRQ